MSTWAPKHSSGTFLHREQHFVFCANAAPRRVERLGEKRAYGGPSFRHAIGCQAILAALQTFRKLVPKLSSAEPKFPSLRNRPWPMGRVPDFSEELSHASPRG